MAGNMARTAVARTVQRRDSRIVRIEHLAAVRLQQTPPPRSRKSVAGRPSAGCRLRSGFRSPPPTRRLAMARRRSSPIVATVRPLWRLERLEERFTPATFFQWDGRPDGGGVSPDNHWTTSANWVGDVAPPPGPALEFPAAAAQLANVNDFPAGTAFGVLNFTGSNYVIAGNRITLSGGIGVTLPSGDGPHIGLDLTLATPATFLMQSTGPILRTAPLNQF